MQPREQARRFGIWVVLCALGFRLYLEGILYRAAETLMNRTAEIIHTETETGRAVRSFDALFGFAPESPPPMQPTEPDGAPSPLPEFSESDAALLSLRNSTLRKPDLTALLTGPLPWEDAPEVLILHTHTTESYTRTGEDYEETADYRTDDESYNMLSIGDRLEALLREGGLTVYHDRTLHDTPSYVSSYSHARETIRQQLREHPRIGLILDIHRDALEEKGKQLPTRCPSRPDCAQLMLVVGSDLPGRPFPDWETNLGVALKLQVLLERRAPGITRPTLLRNARYNQDLSPGGLIIEVGTAGNTHPEALAAMDCLAEAVRTLLTGE